MNAFHFTAVAITIRIAGIAAGVMLLVFALTMLLLPGEHETFSESLGRIFNGFFYVLVSGCLFVPNRLIKSVQTATHFLHFFDPLIFGLLVALVIFGNVWVSYVHQENLSSGA